MKHFYAKGRAMTYLQRDNRTKLFQYPEQRPSDEALGSITDYLQLYFRIKLRVYIVLLMALAMVSNGFNFFAKLPKGIQAVLTLVCIVSMFTVSAQELPGNQRAANGLSDSIAGKVISTENKIYLQNVEIRNRLDETIALTDARGGFRISGTAAHDTLSFYYRGYKPVSLMLRPSTQRPQIVPLDLDTPQIERLVVGDTLPTSLSEQAFRLVAPKDGKPFLRLADHMDKKLLVLDFWTVWCTPCIKSVNEWHKMKQIYGDDLEIVTVHVDYEYKARPFVEQQGWTLPTVYGPGFDLLNRSFFDKYQTGGVVWIQGGKVTAIYYGCPENYDLVGPIMRGEPVTPRSTLPNTYMTGKEQGHER
ncbi:TlpA family protein disulfide reductase [Sphingobacterium sp. SYP-B4668]|uniref:TlpA family protein disulfide reductase n=1 Tax=Sphingobacterium sp. SYP-B4668 TaxID=2996035 RepID=UPI0022DD243D|nr:TlpA disulfide reductase family protein [Sphingobacterium sp. SYP-B4668]